MSSTQVDLDGCCYSGGAEGADLAWGEAAKTAGQKVVHFTFKGHRGSTRPDAKIITPDMLRVGDPILVRVNEEALHRSFPAHSDFVTNLLRRNYWQVANSNAVYAVAGIDWEKNQVYGGTAWAVECFKLMNPESDAIYVFDQTDDKWYTWFSNLGSFVDEGEPPTPRGDWTGIGTRDLTDTGRDAIKELFNR